MRHLLIREVNQLRDGGFYKKNKKKDLKKVFKKGRKQKKKKKKASQDIKAI